jgi:hypothetical protein
VAFWLPIVQPARRFASILFKWRVVLPSFCSNGAAFCLDIVQTAWRFASILFKRRGVLPLYCSSGAAFCLHIVHVARNLLTWRRHSISLHMWEP